MTTITRSSDRERERLRRSAIGPDQGPNDEQQKYGNLYGPQSLEFLQNEGDPTSPSFPFLRRIRRDHVVSMGLHFIAMPIVKAPWYYEADDARMAAFADNLIRPIYGRLVLTLLRMLWAGYSPAAKNFEVIKPTWQYLPGVNADPARVWDNGDVGAFVYKPVTPLRPENCVPVYSGGNFAGIKYDNSYGGVGYFRLDGERKPDIDLLHSVWAVHDQENEDGSPFGYPRIAHCAPIFHMYSYIWTLLARAFENNADPGPVMRYPQEELGAIDSDGKQINNARVAIRLGTRKRSGSAIAMPSDTWKDDLGKPTSIKKWDIEYPKADTSFAEIQNFLGFLESAKLRSIWLQEQGLIEGSGGQSNRNVASEFGDKRDASQEILMGQIDDLIDKVFVAPAMAMNFPNYEGKLVKRTLGFGSSEDDIVRQILQLAGQDDFRRFGVDVRRLLETKSIPMLSYEDLKAQREEAAKATEKIPTPEVTPDQGRRALVTQTGFDRSTDQPVMSYVQIEDPIVLSADGDFVAALPKTDVYSDKKILAATRDLRNASTAFLTWIYADFTIYLGKQKTLDLGELLIEIGLELAQEGLADDPDEKIKRAVDRIMRGWRPRADRLAAYSTKVKGSLTTVFERTAGVQLERVRSKARVLSTEDRAAAWLKDRGAESVTNILETTRTQMRAALTQGVAEGLTVKEIAKDLRERFEGLPASRASTIARTEVGEAFNYATVTAGLAAGVSQAQLIDGTDDPRCKKRNGKIVKLVDALSEHLNHPNCQLFVKLLPKASAELTVRDEELAGYLARFDEDTQTVLFSTRIDDETRTSYLLALGDMLAEASDVEQLVA